MSGRAAAGPPWGAAGRGRVLCGHLGLRTTYFTGTLTTLVARVVRAQGGRWELGSLARLVALTGGAAAGGPLGVTGVAIAVPVLAAAAALACLAAPNTRAAPPPPRTEAMTGETP